MKTYAFVCVFLVVSIFLPVSAQIYWAYGIIHTTDPSPEQHQLSAILGEPDADETGTQSKNAWTVKFNQQKTTSVTVGFEKFIPVQKIFVAENLGISPKEIILIDEQGFERDRYVINDNFDVSLDIVSKISHVTRYYKTNYLVSAVKLIVSQSLLGDEISQVDAIGISEYDISYIRPTQKPNIYQIYAESGLDETHLEASTLSTPITLSGEITETYSEEPIDSVMLYFIEHKNQTLQTTRTDIRGIYKIVLSPAVYSVITMKEGYLASSPKVIHLDKAEKNELQLDMQLTEMIPDTTYKFYNIEFQPNSLEFEASSIPILERFRRTLEANPNIIVSISVHTDSRGNDEYNLKLSQQRAKRIFEYLVEKNIDPSRLKAEGFGETQLINHCKNGVLCSNEEHLQNRRVEFKITGYLK
ncbi:MAG: OmpA family protein [Cytophagales bacterium]|nr:OmpA family protein [Cytophagales bacterium]MDW8383948.1 OmpA family protein [Flammeovirgaceae bacterium]